MVEDHDIPDELASLIRALARFTGDVGDAAELDWAAQTVTIIGQVGSDPEQYDAESIEAMLDVVDGNVSGLLKGPYKGDVVDSYTTDAGFRYVIDISMYGLPEEPKKTRIPFNTDAETA